MKRSYESPRIAVERFVLSNQITSCSAIRINSMDMICVVQDGNAPGPMVDLAYDGFFLAEGLCNKFPSDEEDGLCYYTSTNLAFTS